MSQILDEISFPFSDPVAQELHMTLTRLNPTPEEAVRVAENAGLQRFKLDLGGAVIDQWHEILRKAAQEGLTRALVTTARDELRDAHPRRQFFDDLLQSRLPAIGNEPRAQDGRPLFLQDDDTIGEPEALLFKEDLTLQTGLVLRLIGTLQRLLELAPAVCLFHVELPGARTRGTGFRIGENRLLTNWHVLHNRLTGEPATAAKAEFGFDEDGDGNHLPSTAIRCDVTTIHADREDDWAVIEAAEPLRAEWPIIRLSAAAEPVVPNPAYIVQHPNGERKRVGFVRNKVTLVNEKILHYVTDTQEGSSGSPIFDREGRLIGLHHVGGTPQDLTGVEPLSKNEGIRIPRVVEGLAGYGITVD